MVLNGIFPDDFVKIGLNATNKEETFIELVDFFVAQNPRFSKDSLLDALWARESKLSTGISKGFALPHAQVNFVSKVKGIIGISHKGIDYDALDGNPVHVVFMLFSNVDSMNLYLRTLRRISLLVKTPMFLEELIAQRSPEALFQVIKRFEEQL